MTSGSNREQRERAGVVALMLALWAVVLGPAIHLASHRDDHTHGPTEAGGAHDHGGRSHRHADKPVSTDHRATDRVADLYCASGLSLESGDNPPAGGLHGAGSMAHFALAFAEAVVAAGTTRGAPVELDRVIPSASIAPRIRRTSHDARGPPAPAPIVQI